MSDSGIKFKYRVGNAIQQCALYTSADDKLNSNDLTLPVQLDNTTYYLIAVNPANFGSYSVSAVETIINDINYRLALCKVNEKSMDFLYYGSKNMSVATAAANFYSKFYNYITTTGHDDFMTVKKISTGIEVTFKNIKTAYITGFDIIGAGGNGGYGGLAKDVQSGTTVVKTYGAGGGGGEAGARIENSTIKQITKAYFEYTNAAGEVRIRAWNGSSLVINSTATFGANGGNANYDTVGTGGKGRTNGTDGSDGYKTNITASTEHNSNAATVNTSKGGTGGSGGVLWEIMHGHGGAGGNGSESTTSRNAGGTGSGWYFSAKLKYTLEG